MGAQVTEQLQESWHHTKLYHLNVTADGEPAALFALAEDGDSLLHTLEYQDHEEADEKCLLPHFDGEKTPRLVSSLKDVPENDLDFVCLGDNPKELTLAEFLDTQAEAWDLTCRVAALSTRQTRIVYRSHDRMPVPGAWRISPNRSSGAVGQWRRGGRRASSPLTPWLSD